MSKPEEGRGSPLRRLASTNHNRRQSPERRTFLRSGGALAGAAVASVTGITAAGAQRLEIPQTEKEMGRIIDPEAYGMPSKFEAQVKRRRTDVLVNKQNWS